MKFEKLNWILLAPSNLFAMVYVAGAIMLATDDRTILTLEGDRSDYQNTAMREGDLENGDKLGPSSIIRYRDACEKRQQ